MQAVDFPRAAIIAGRLDVVAHTGSTNADLLVAVAGEPDAYPHLSVLITDQAIYQSNMPFAAAMAVFLVLVTLGMVALTLLIGRKGEAA